MSGVEMSNLRNLIFSRFSKNLKIKSLLTKASVFLYKLSIVTLVFDFALIDVIKMGLASV